MNNNFFLRKSEPESVFICMVNLKGESHPFVEKYSPSFLYETTKWSIVFVIRTVLISFQSAPKKNY